MVRWLWTLQAYTGWKIFGMIRWSSAKISEKKSQNASSSKDQGWPTAEKGYVVIAFNKGKGICRKELYHLCRFQALAYLLVLKQHQ